MKRYAELDEDLMEKYLDGEEITNEELINGIRKGTLNVEFYPVVCGTAFKNKGVQKVLDAVVALSSITNLIFQLLKVLTLILMKKLNVILDDSEPFSALAFKVMTDPYVGKLTFFRVYSGILESGSYVQNSTKGKRERVGRILQMHANSREEISEVYAGDIAAAVGLKDTTTGDTLCDEKALVILESMEFPEPVISLSVEPKSKADQDKMGPALTKTFRRRSNIPRSY